MPSEGEPKITIVEQRLNCAHELQVLYLGVPYLVTALTDASGLPGYEDNQVARSVVLRIQHQLSPGDEGLGFEFYELRSYDPRHKVIRRITAPISSQETLPESSTDPALLELAELIQSKIEGNWTGLVRSPQLEAELLRLLTTD